MTMRFCLQLLPRFVMTVFSDLPGFAGLFLATLYGGALRSDVRLVKWQKQINMKTAEFVLSAFVVARNTKSKICKLYKREAFTSLCIHRLNTHTQLYSPFENAKTTQEMLPNIFSYTYTSAKAKSQPNVIRDSNPDFRINSDSDPDVCRIAAKMLWSHLFCRRRSFRQN